MTSRRLTTTVLFSLLILPLAVPAQTPQECTQFDDVAIVATNSVHLKQSSAVIGDVVANDASAGPVLDLGVELSIERNATVDGNARADSISLSKGASITGVAECNDGTGVACSGLTLPVFDDLPPFLTVDVRPEAADVVVDDGEIEVLAPGEYGDVTVAQNGTLLLDGDYRFRSVAPVSTAGGQCPYPCRAILIGGATEVRVQERFDLGKDSCVTPGAAPKESACSPQGAPIGASGAEAIFYVGGPNGGAGEPGSLPAAATVGKDSVVAANFYAPNGTFLLDRDSVMRGAAFARDVRIDRGSKVTEDTFFFNRAPQADDQSATTLGAASVEITLTGSDPDGGGLTFSVPADGQPGYPAAGDLGNLTPIVPAPVNRCSVSGGSCSVDTDCPLYPNESCETSQPPTTSATVTYTPDVPSAEAEDAFNFTVTDECGLSDTGTVTVNPVETGGEDPADFAANDLEQGATAGTPTGIVLSAGPSSDPITYTVISLPTGGSLQDSAANAIESVPYALPDSVVFYTSDAGTTDDSFDYEATDGTSTDDATVTIAVQPPYELAPDQQVVTAIDSPIQISLLANPGGVGSGGQAPQSQAARAPAVSLGIGGLPAPTAGSANGFVADRGGRITADASGQNTGPHNLIFGAGWTSTSTVPPAFFWGAGEPVFAQDGPFLFSGPGCVSVTDDFTAGDEFRIYDNGQPIGTTSSVAEGTVDVDNGPDVAFADPAYSSGSFLVGSGSHSITVEVIANPFGGGRAYIRVDSECIKPNLEVTSFSAPASALVDEAIGDQVFTTIQNTGTANIAPGTSVSIGFYQSADATITTNDRLLSGGRENLASQAPNGLAIGESVAIDLFDGANISSTFPDESPLLGDVYLGVVLDEFNTLDESDEGDNTASQAISVAVNNEQPLQWEITALPTNGTLKTLTGSLVVVGQTFQTQPTLVYTPDSGFTGTNSINYQVTQGTVIDDAVIDIAITALGSCLDSEAFCLDGRESGPGGQAPQTASLPTSGPSVTLEVEGPGSIAVAPLGVGHGRLTASCAAKCAAGVIVGETLVVAARPTGADSEFVGFRGDCSGSRPLTLLTAGDGKRCVALFRTVER